MLQLRFSFITLLTVILITACGDSGSTEKNTTNSPSDEVQSTAAQELGKKYSNAEYDITLNYPDQWILLEEANLEPAMGTFGINIFKRGTGAEKETPLHVHAKAQHSYIAIWPHGYGTELPASQYARLDTLKNIPAFQFDVDMDESKALLLNDGSIWAYSIKPANPPVNWNSSGFIFAHVASENNQSTCYDGQTGEEKPLNQCDFLGGDDRYVREGDIIKNDAQTIHQMLESISLKNVQEQTKAADLIDIEKPGPNMDVTSPMQIKGKARGSWYFEGSFLVELVDYKDHVLAEKQIQAQGKWMTDDFVPFKTTLEFDAPDDERGYLIFHRANPSGLEKNAMEWSQPVIFPPK